MQQYRDFLSREGDNRGIEFWTAELESGLRTRAMMVESFIGSPEFEGVDRTRRAALLRLLPAHPRLRGCSTGSTAARGHLARRDLAAFASSPEFVNRYGSLTNSQFVDRVYATFSGARRIPRRSRSGPARSTRACDAGQVMLAFSGERRVPSVHLHRGVRDDAVRGNAAPPRPIPAVSTSGWGNSDSAIRPARSSTHSLLPTSIAGDSCHEAES
jgi:hypothetical protein